MEIKPAIRIPNPVRICKSHILRLPCKCVTRSVAGLLGWYLIRADLPLPVLHSGDVDFALDGLRAGEA